MSVARSIFFRLGRIKSSSTKMHPALTLCVMKMSKTCHFLEIGQANGGSTEATKLRVTGAVGVGVALTLGFEQRREGNGFVAGTTRVPSESTGSQSEEVREELFSGLGQYRLRMELHTFYLHLLVAETHDEPVRRPG